MTPCSATSRGFAPLRPLRGAFGALDVWPARGVVEESGDGGRVAPLGALASGRERTRPLHAEPERNDLDVDDVAIETVVIEALASASVVRAADIDESPTPGSRPMRSPALVLR